MWKLIQQPSRTRPGLVSSILIVGLLMITGAVLAANEGTITSLSASDAPGFNQTVTISAAFLANAKVNNTNVYYEIIAPDGTTVVASHTTAINALDAGQTFSDLWTTANASFPASGTYTLRACWSPGSSLNCSIDGRGQVSTTFFSVPTLGFWLTLVGVALLGLLLWLRRNDFRRLMPQTNPAHPDQESHGTLNKS